MVMLECHFRAAVQVPVVALPTQLLVNGTGKAEEDGPSPGARATHTAEQHSAAGFLALAWPSPVCCWYVGSEIWPFRLFKRVGLGRGAGTRKGSCKGLLPHATACRGLLGSPWGLSSALQEVPPCPQAGTDTGPPQVHLMASTHFTGHRTGLTERTTLSGRSVVLGERRSCLHPGIGR